ncbi:ubiquinol-cytochrome C chaperone family protein [Paraburkholderia sp. IMGN_8]|uniref:YaaW family protein n=1 Tax=Paraburkholderia sp. IMGN_8 TaxID=3136564 RepID=UPI003100C43E
MSDNFIKNPGNLSLLLAQSDIADLDILVDYITKSGTGRISLSDDVCARLVKCKERRVYSEFDRGLIGHEICAFGGNTLTNVYRDVRNSIPLGNLLDKVLPEVGTTITYDEVVKDVAAHLKVAFDKKDDLLLVEDSILRKFLRDSFEKMSPEERATVLKELNVSDLSMLKPAAGAAFIAAGRMGGFATYTLSLIVANAVSKALLGRGLPLAVNATLSRTIGLLLGPIGWVVTGVWTLADMASPAYRVTLPCVIQIAYMRQKAIVEAHTKACTSCGARNERASRFCAECGQAFQGA